MPNQIRGDLVALAKQIEDLVICVGEVDAGYVAYTKSEPFFCIERGSLDELKFAVHDTLVSYVSTFYHVDKSTLNVAFEDIPAKTAPAVPVHRVKPVSRLRPNFDTLDSPPSLLAMV